MERWQLISRKSRELFDILRDPDNKTWLSTVELPRISISDLEYGYLYETCIFPDDRESEVLEQYYTQEQAIAGHEKYRIKYGLVDF